MELEVSTVWGVVPANDEVWAEYDNDFIPSLFATQELAEGFIENNGWQDDYEVVELSVYGKGY